MAVFKPRFPEARVLDLLLGRNNAIMEPENRAHPKGAILPLTNVWPGDCGRDT